LLSINKPIEKVKNKFENLINRKQKDIIDLENVIK